jgi:hypothetical protein
MLPGAVVVTDGAVTEFVVEACPLDASTGLELLTPL